MTRFRPISTRIDAPPDRVWHLIGPRFADIGLWATTVPHSQASQDPEPLGAAPVPGRVCTSNVPMVPKVTETITAYDPEGHTLTYVATEGTPFFVTTATNTWSVDADGPAASIVTVTATVEPAGALGRLIVLAALPMLRRIGRRTLRDLKRFAESAPPAA